MASADRRCRPMAARNSPAVANLLLSKSITWNFTAMKRSCPSSGIAIPTGSPPNSMTCLNIVSVSLSQSVKFWRSFRRCRCAHSFFEAKTTNEGRVGGCVAKRIEAMKSICSHRRTPFKTGQIYTVGRLRQRNASCEEQKNLFIARKRGAVGRTCAGSRVFEKHYPLMPRSPRFSSHLKHDR